MPILDVGCGISGSARRLVNPDEHERRRQAGVAAGDLSRAQAWNDKTDLAQKAFANAKEPGGEPSQQVLGVDPLVGTDIQRKACNLHRILDEERVSLIEVLVVKSAPVETRIG